jgi:hypothetical protein
MRWLQHAFFHGEPEYKSIVSKAWLRPIPRHDSSAGRTTTMATGVYDEEFLHGGPTERSPQPSACRFHPQPHDPFPVPARYNGVSRRHADIHRALYVDMSIRRLFDTVSRNRGTPTPLRQRSRTSTTTIRYGTRFAGRLPCHPFYAGGSSAARTTRPAPRCSRAPRRSANINLRPECLRRLTNRAAIRGRALVDGRCFSMAPRQGPTTTGTTPVRAGPAAGESHTTKSCAGSQA